MPLLAGILVVARKRDLALDPGHLSNVAIASVSYRNPPQTSEATLCCASYRPGGAIVPLRTTFFGPRALYSIGQLHMIPSRPKVQFPGPLAHRNVGVVTSEKKEAAELK